MTEKENKISAQDKQINPEETPEEKEFREKIYAQWHKLFYSYENLASKIGIRANDIRPIGADTEIPEAKNIYGEIHVVVDCLFTNSEGKPKTIVIEAINNNKLIERVNAEALWKENSMKLINENGYQVGDDSEDGIGSLTLLRFANSLLDDYEMEYSTLNGDLPFNLTRTISDLPKSESIRLNFAPGDRNSSRLN